VRASGRIDLGPNGDGVERDDHGLPLNFGGREAKMEAKREKAKETWHKEVEDATDKKMNDLFGRSLAHASTGYNNSLAKGPPQEAKPMVATAETASLVAQASGKMQVNPARLALITGSQAAGINPARLAMMTGQAAPEPEEPAHSTDLRRPSPSSRAEESGARSET